MAAFDAAISIAPDEARGWHGRAGLKLDAGDRDGAIADATVAVAKRRDFVEAYNVRALAHYYTLQYEAALADMKVVTELAPLAATPRITRARVYETLGRYDEAEADLVAASDRNPTAAETAAIEAERARIAARRKADRK